MQDIMLVTGGAGFIGSHLVERLVRHGHRVRVIDNLATGRRSNLAHLSPDAIEFVQAPVGTALQDPAVMAGVTHIYHLAAAVGVKLCVEHPAAMIQNNLEETRVVLETALRHRARVLIASSSEVYGKCPVLPLDEEMDLLYGPTQSSRWAYGMSKALDEHLALDFARSHGLEAVIVRLFNTIGPRQVGHYGMVVPRFVAQAVAGVPLGIHGDGSQTRAFCDVRDVTWAMTQLMARPANPEAIYNLGSPHEITIRQLATDVIQLAGSTSTLAFTPYHQVYGERFEDPPRRLPNIQRLRQAIGFAPTIPLEQTLSELIALARMKREE